MQLRRLVLAALGALALSTCGGSQTGGSTSTATPLVVVAASIPIPHTFAAVLQNVGENGPGDSARIDALAASPYDAILIDEIGTSSSAFASTQNAIIARLHASAGTTFTHKTVYGYVNIGEAESFRSYWQPAWQPGSPSFILSGTDPNGFSGDYPVNFGSPEWQSIVYGSHASLIDRAIADGFDGVYLDWVTGYNFAPVQALDPNAQFTMTTFVAAISAYAKAKRPGFVIIAQNAPELAADPRYTRAVDAVLQEDLFYANSATQAGDIAQSPAVTANLLREFSVLEAGGKTIFSIDYATTAANAADAYRRAKGAGIVEYVGNRALGALSSFPPL